MKIVALQPGEAALFGYGSLLLLSSMERTLGRKYTRERYVCSARGWRRTWDSLYPNNTFFYQSPAGERLYPRNILYLNIRPSEGMLNGVLYVISKSELMDFDKREAVYDRIGIHGDLDIEVTGGSAYAYVGKPPYLMTSPMRVEDAAIRASYISIVDKGLEELGAGFRLAYEASTEAPPAENIIQDQTV